MPGGRNGGRVGWSTWLAGYAENDVVTEDTDRDGDGVVDKHRIFTDECFQ